MGFVVSHFRMIRERMVTSEAHRGNQLLIASVGHVTLGEQSKGNYS